MNYYRGFADDRTFTVLATRDDEGRWLLAASGDGRTLTAVSGGAEEIEREARRAIAAQTGNDAQDLRLEWEFRALGCPSMLYKSAATMVTTTKLLQGG